MNWEAIRKEYETTKLTLAAFAEKYDVKLGTLKSRKSREGWSRGSPKKDATKPKKVATIEGKHPQRNRSGNPNPPNQFSHRNNPKLLHGLRSKFLHEEQIEIMEAVEGLDIADQLWFQIEIKFSAIVRMQKIMWVANANDHLSEESGSSWGDGSGSESFKVVFAHERYESYIKAQSRAMGEYRSLVKQFLELAHNNDERRLKIEHMQLNIEKTKAEINELTNEGGSGNKTIIITGEDEMRMVLNESD